MRMWRRLERMSQWRKYIDGERDLASAHKVRGSVMTWYLRYERTDGSVSVAFSRRRRAMAGWISAQNSMTNDVELLFNCIGRQDTYRR